jgi:hypothetical protein
MEQHKHSLIVLGGICRSLEDEDQNQDGDRDHESIPEIFICSLSKYIWSKLALDCEFQFLAFSAVSRPSENELLMFGGSDWTGKEN